MKQRTLPLLGGLAVISALILTNCGSDGEPGKEGTYNDNASASSPDSLCIVNPSWFPHAQTPAPAEGKGSPFDASSTTNQIFHQWSWNKFLWLTKPDKGGNPLFLNTSKVKQVTSTMLPISVPDSTLVVLQDTAQAGSSALLQTNPGYNNGVGGKVYYSIHMNPLMYDAAVAFGLGIKNGIIKPTNDKVFPVGSFELKVAWVPISAIPQSKQSLYYTTTASLSTNAGKSFTNTKVALIGMHVVGIVENHPEFIWATFEHDDLSPDYDWKAKSASSDLDQLLFKKGSVTGIGGITYNSTSQLGNTPNQVFDLFQYGVPLDSDGNFMMNTSQSGSAEFQNIDGINQCVKSQLDDVWANYFYNGSIWLNMDGTTHAQQAQIIDSLGNNMGNATTGSYARGSLNCANVTMESFTQTFEDSIQAINVNNLVNCFTCHSSSQKDKATKQTITSPLYISHVFRDYVRLKQGATPKQIEEFKSAEEQRILKFVRAR
ncbi:hypothetical protein [Fluviicola sp.]|uniref:hypothetical protein n=1 Tax=Fluviicola sp. TaxID=1917219 RepID=UPI0031DD4F5C